MKKRSVKIAGHATSISLENEFWDELNRLAEIEGIAVSALIARIDESRHSATNLSSALRLYVLRNLRSGENKGS